MTRHNVGWLVLDCLHDRWGWGKGRSAFDGLFVDGRLQSPDGQSIRTMLLKPLTFMNRSGQSVRQALDFYKLQPEDVLIVMDDMALPIDRIRLRAGGSAGGHNGLDDVIRCLGTRDVPRLRVGIGACPPGWDPKAYVLGRFSSDEKEEVGVSIQDAADAAEDWVFRGIQKAMEKYNRKPGS